MQQNKSDQLDISYSTADPGFGQLNTLSQANLNPGQMNNLLHIFFRNLKYIVSAMNHHNSTEKC